MTPAPYDLKISLLEDARSVKKANAVFSWKLPQTAGACQQTAFRIQIAHMPEDFSGAGPVYDSQEVRSEEHLCVRIKELETLLEDDCVYFWRVMAVLDNGTATPFCEPACFITAPDYRKNPPVFVKAPDPAGQTNHMVFMRAPFSAHSDQKAVRILLRMSALSGEGSRQYVFKAFLNGSFTGLGPAVMSGNTLYYNTFDITDEVSEQNIFAVQLYSSQIPPQVFFEITAFYGDGTRRILLSSAKHASEVRVLPADAAAGICGAVNTGTPYYYFPAENYDFSLYDPDWITLQYDDAVWEKAVQLSPGDTAGYSPEPYPCENIRCFEVPCEIRKQEQLSYTVRLQREIIGHAKIQITSDCEQTVTLHFGEEVRDGKLVFPMRTGNRYEAVFRLKKGDNRVWPFGMMAWRYAEVFFEKSEPQTFQISGQALHNGQDDRKSGFVCNDELLRAVYDVSKYTIKATNLDIMTDSQSRERRAYEGDLLINALSAYTFDDRYALARFSASWLDRNGTWPAEYPLFQIISAYNDYMYTGNDQLLHEDYELLKGFANAPAFDDMGQGRMLANTGHIKPSAKGAVLVDWPSSEHDGYQCDQVVYNTVYNALCCGAEKTMSLIAAVLKKNDDRAYFLNKAGSLKKAINELLYDEETGSFCDGMDENRSAVKHFAQHAAAFCLEYDICDSADKRSRTAEFAARTSEIRTSVYGAYFLLSGLYKCSFAEQAKALMCSRGLRSWHHMINELGATITTEAWDPSIKANMTFSHPWGSAAAAVIMRGMFGIVPTQPGFREFNIHIQPGNAGSAAICVPTAAGKISVKFTAEGEKLKNAQLCIPQGTAAKFVLNDFENRAAVFSAIQATNGVICSDGSSDAVLLQPGSYSFTG